MTFDDYHHHHGYACQQQYDHAYEYKQVGIVRYQESIAYHTVGRVQSYATAVLDFIVIIIRQSDSDDSAVTSDSHHAYDLVSDFGRHVDGEFVPLGQFGSCAVICHCYTITRGYLFSAEYGIQGKSSGQRRSIIFQIVGRQSGDLDIHSGRNGAADGDTAFCQRGSLDSQRCLNVFNVIVDRHCAFGSDRILSRRQRIGQIRKRTGCIALDPVFDHADNVQQIRHALTVYESIISNHVIICGIRGDGVAVIEEHIGNGNGQHGGRYSALFIPPDGRDIVGRRRAGYGIYYMQSFLVLGGNVG